MTNTQQEANVRSASGWRPVQGDTISGTVAGIRAGESEYGRYPVVTLALDTEDPDAVEYVAVHAFHSSLRTELTTHKPAVGDRLTIAYGGLVEGKREDPETGEKIKYHVYTVTPEKAEAFWSGF